MSALSFSKYQACGNAYLVLDGNQCPVDGALLPQMVRNACDNRYGFGGDGLLYGHYKNQEAWLRIFNVDGSEAQLSGNGVRIFSKYLYEQTGQEQWAIRTQAGVSYCSVHRDADQSLVSATIGGAHFVDTHGGRPQLFTVSDSQGYRVDVGVPCFVVPVEGKLDARLAQRVGPGIECHSCFPERTNVQFFQVLGTDAICLEIWERGCGYTLASGTSACAAAALAAAIDLCAFPLKVHMPGGILQIDVSPDGKLCLAGPVQGVGVIHCRL